MKTTNKKRIGALSGLFYAVLLTSATNAQQVYDFDDGTLQGWTLPIAGVPLEWANQDESTTPGLAAHSGSRFVTLDQWNRPFPNRDGQHDTMVFRSPVFTLNGFGSNLDIFLSGGNTGGTLPTSVSDLASHTGTAGAHAVGVGLRRVSDDSYLLTSRRTFHSHTWENVGWNQATLAAFDGEEVTVDLFDSFGGGWGWAAIDSVSLPVNLDTDGDGVLDDVDLCPNTPEGATVDAVGCTVAGLIDFAITHIEGLLAEPGTTIKSAQKLNKALDNLNKAAAALAAGNPEKALKEISDAVKELMKAGAEGADVEAVIALLLQSAQAQAQAAIDAAIAGGGDAKKIAKAQESMAKAQAELAKVPPHYDHAIDDYAKALKEALKAL